MSSLFRSLRTLPIARQLTARPVTSKAIAFPAFRSLSTTPPRREELHDHGGTNPVQIYGPGGKAGTIPTEWVLLLSRK
jgi:hypothetical protein